MADAEFAAALGGDPRSSTCSSTSASGLPIADEPLIRRMARPGPRYTSYPTAPAWHAEGFGAPEYAERLAQAEREGSAAPLSLYLHLPFCREMCRYCGCSVVVTGQSQKVDRYLDYLAREMDLVTAHLPRRRRVEQLHLGGGTPTWLDLRQLERLWQLIGARFSVVDGAELALEVDPRVTSPEQLELLRRCGFTRVSMGVQDFTPEVQEAIGRHQSVALTEALYRAARALGYRTINFDLVYGLPRQRLETFATTLDQALRLRPDRLALFSYAHVPWMRPHQRAIDEGELPDAVQKVRLFELARGKLLAAGYVQVGMDHFAVPSDALAQARLVRRLHRNFQGYITQPSGDTLAFGITAISDVQGAYAQNVKRIADYYRQIDAGELPIERGCALTAEDLLRRDVIHGLMCNFAVDLGQVARAHGYPEGYFAAEVAGLDWAEEAGLLRRSDQTLEILPLGQLFVRNVAMAFDAYLPAQQERPTFSSTV
ncbi:MAG: oxygen-independent coproporphyrinogen III oxidase [Proteobacteria bacterium]|nr:oxygen-independent coproporphyrinogen III oxidase [Pseudomonadota bacterium]